MGRVVVWIAIAAVAVWHPKHELKTTHKDYPEHSRFPNQHPIFRAGKGRNGNPARLRVQCLRFSSLCSGHRLLRCLGVSPRVGQFHAPASGHGVRHRIRNIARPSVIRDRDLKCANLTASRLVRMPTTTSWPTTHEPKKNPHRLVRVPHGCQDCNGISRRLGRSTAAPGPRPDSSATGSTACRWRPQWRCQWLPPGARSELRPHP